MRPSRLRSGGEHCHETLAVEVRRGTLPSNLSVEVWRNTAARPSQLRSGGEHCHTTLAVEVQWGNQPTLAVEDKAEDELT